MVVLVLGYALSKTSQDRGQNFSYSQIFFHVTILTLFFYITGRQKYGIGCEITRKSSQFYGTTENNRSYG